MSSVDVLPASPEYDKPIKGSEFLPTPTEVRAFAGQYFDLEAMKEGKLELEEMLVNPNPRYLKTTFPLFKMGTFRVGVRDEQQGGAGEIMIIPDMTLGVADPLLQLFEPDSVQANTLRRIQAERKTGDDVDIDPYAWPYLRSRHEITARKKCGELQDGFDPPYGVVGELLVKEYKTNTDHRTDFAIAQKEELVHVKAIKAQLIAAIDSDGKRVLAYAYLPDRGSDGADEIIGYTSWIDYIKDNPDVLPYDKRQKVSGMPYETEFHLRPDDGVGGSTPDRSELNSALARLLGVAVRDAASKDSSWQSAVKREE